MSRSAGPWGSSMSSWPTPVRPRGRGDRRGGGRLGLWHAASIRVAGDRRVRLGEPDLGAAHRRVRPARRVRGRARPAARARRPRASRREYYFNNAGSQVTRLGRVGARPRAPRTGARGRLPGRLRRPTLARQHPGRRRAGRGDARRDRRRGADHGRASARRWRAYRVEFDSYFLEGSLLRRRPVADRRSRSSVLARAGPHATSPRARCGCARPRSATTRTACCCARPARRPTSRPTSPTTRTRSGAATTALIDVLGADHHGYIGRMKGVMAALGHEARPARDPDPAVRARRRGRRARRRCPSAAATSSRSTS